MGVPLGRMTVISSISYEPRRARTKSTMTIGAGIARQEHVRATWGKVKAQVNRASDVTERILGVVWSAGMVLPCKEAKLGMREG